MTDKLRINFLLPHVQISGGVKAVMEYANRIHQLGHDVTLFSLAPKKRGLSKYLSYFQVQETSRIPKEAVSWFPLECPLYQVPSLDSKWLPEADVHVATCWETAQPIANATRKSGKGFYFVQHHEVLWARDKRSAARSYMLPLKKMVVSQWLKKVLQEEYQQESLQLIVPIDASIFYEDAEVKRSPLRICLLHHDYDWKGFNDALAALKLVRDEFPDIQPVVFGAKIKTYEDFRERYDFSCEYHYRPPLNELRSLYSSSCIYVCSSWLEGLGLPGMEAMMCGAALVTTDTGGCWDYAIPNETALVSPPRDSKALADNIKRLLRDPQMRERMAQKGQARVQGFTWDDYVRKMIDYFKS